MKEKDKKEEVFVKKKIAQGTWHLFHYFRNFDRNKSTISITVHEKEDNIEKFNEE